MAVSTQDLFYTRTIDLVHINPSIMEGEVNNSSLLGQETAVELVRYAPILQSNPIITGILSVPNTLTCSEGVFDASPRSFTTYQWKRNGIDIIGETNNTYVTAPVDDAVNITCAIVATNTEGSDVGLSNILSPYVILPINLMETANFVISGLSQSTQQNLLTQDSLVFTGMGHPTRIDVMGKQNTVITGTGHPTRIDVMADDSLIVTGLQSAGALSSNGLDIYAVWKPTFEESLAIINPGGDTGDETGWTLDSGLAESTLPVSPFLYSGNLAPVVGTHYWWSTITHVAGILSQVVDLSAGLYTQIDAGEILADLKFYMASALWQQSGTVRLEFLNAADGVIGELDKWPSLTKPGDYVVYTGWARKVVEPVFIPTLTRKIKVYIEFGYTGQSFSNLYIDEVKVDLYSVTI